MKALGVQALLPRALYRYRVHLTRVLDLTDEAVLSNLDTSQEVVTGESWLATQELGAAAHRLGWQAILAPSATRTDDVLAVFPELLGSGDLVPSLLEIWNDVEDLTPRGE